MQLLDKRAKLSLKIEQDLEQRSRQGMWALPLCIAMVSLTTGLGHRARATMVVATVLLVLQMIFRFLVLTKVGAKVMSRPRHWSRIHILLLMLCAAVWGGVTGSSILRFGYGDRDVLMLLLYHAAVAFGIANQVVHERRLIYASQALMFLPLIVGNFFSGSNGGSPFICAVMLYGTYCVIQAIKLNRIYEEHISDNYELSVAAYRDCLTGLPNRLYMHEVLDEQVREAQEKRLSLALLYIDLDGFKQINDLHSHKMGDLFLCEAATRISGCLRSGDVAARIGGDEFTILLPYASESEALGLANRVLRSAREPLVIEGQRLHYSTSIGVSVFPAAAGTADHLVRAADEAMYAAKTSGKDRVCLAPSFHLLEDAWTVPPAILEAKWQSAPSLSCG